MSTTNTTSTIPTGAPTDSTDRFDFDFLGPYLGYYSAFYFSPYLGYSTYFFSIAFFILGRSLSGVALLFFIGTSSFYFLTFISFSFFLTSFLGAYFGAYFLISFLMGGFFILSDLSYFFYGFGAKSPRFAVISIFYPKNRSASLITSVIDLVLLTIFYFYYFLFTYIL